MSAAATGGVQGRLIDEPDYLLAVSVFRHDNYRRQVMRPATDRRSPRMMYVTYTAVWQSADLRGRSAAMLGLPSWKSVAST